MATLEREAVRGRAMTRIEVVGLVMVLLALLGLLVGPGTIAGTFDAMIKRVFDVVVKIYITGRPGPPRPSRRSRSPPWCSHSSPSPPSCSECWP